MESNLWTAKQTKALVSYELFEIKTITKKKLFLNIYFTLVKVCRVEKKRRKDDIAIWEEYLMVPKRFIIFWWWMI